MRFLLSLVGIVFTSAAFGSDEYIPLAVGNEWTMDVTRTAPDGDVSNAVFHCQITGMDERNGKTYYRALTTMEWLTGRMSSYKLFRKDQTGFYTLDPNDKNATEQTEVRFPVKVGQTWQRTMEQSTVTGTIVGLEPVKINGKTYENCCHIRTAAQDGSYTKDEWEAPGVGSLRLKVAYSNRAKMSMTLRKFKPGK